MRLVLVSLSIMLWCLATPAHASDPCPQLRGQTDASEIATRIAATACNEHVMWYRAFIDRNGKVASTRVVEAENALLADQATPAWQRVTQYWRETGLLTRLGVADTQRCQSAPADPDTNSRCRSFIVDNPWSAAFISWVMSAAGVPAFRPSASHIDYVRDAFRTPENSPFVPMDPALATPAQGDLLCFVRGGDPLGFTGLQRIATRGQGGLAMHCDIVAAAAPNGDNMAYLIGGNVQQTVTMRLLPLNRKGTFWNLPQRTDSQAPCTPDNEAACNFNQQDWAVLLKLKPSTVLAQMQATTTTPSLQTDRQQRVAPPANSCCIQCMLGSGVPRCPATAPTLSPGGTSSEPPMP